jgi:Family of unknown function (DUF6328)
MEVINGRNETPFERCDRNILELLQEVRIAQTAVQVLLGFLVAVAFTPRFRTLSGFQRMDYFATLLAASIGTILLIAPASYHRILFRLGDKQHIVDAANRLVIAGLGAVAAAIVGVSLLLSDLLFAPPLTIGMGTITIVACSATWYVLPLARRRSVRARANGSLGTTPASTAVLGGTRQLGMRTDAVSSTHRARDADRLRARGRATSPVAGG